MKTLVITSFLVITAVAIVSIIAPTVFGREQDTAKHNPASAEPVTARVDKLFAEWNRSDSPGCSLGVSQNGVPVYQHGYGAANLPEVRVGDRALVTAMETPAIPTGWPDGSSYGYGLEIAQYRGLRTIGHGGGDPGIASYVVRYPDQGFAVALLCNLDNIGENENATALTQRVADIYLSDVFPSPPAKSLTAAPPHVTLSAEQLASKVGLYRDPVTESVGRIFLRDGKLMASEGVGEGESVELTPVSENRFVISGTPVVAEFFLAAPGRPQEVRVTGVGPKPVVSQKLGAFTPSIAELRSFAGEYTSVEVEGTYTLVARDSGLALQIPGRNDIVLQPIFADAFAGGVVGVVKFSRDARGAVTGFTANSSGVRALRFDRVKR